MKVVIIGAGIGGLAIGWRLAQVGCEVEVLERGLVGQGATWASAGMIATEAETGIEDTPLAPLAREARALWPAFAREIEAASGEPVRFREDGALLVAFDEEEEGRLRGIAAALAARDVRARWLEGDEARQCEPLLALNARGALHAADSAQVDNRLLSPALGHALRRAGGRLREQVAVHSLAVDGERVRGVVSAQATHAADAVIVAAGAWCNGLGGVASGVLPPVRPVKGQMAALVPPAGATMPNQPASDSYVYIVPRGDRLLVGATFEEAGFDTAVTREGVDWLLAGATGLAPSLRRWRVAESWAGLRPATPDGLPVLGAAAIQGLFVASGQFRNGILLASAIADHMRRIVMGEAVPDVLRAFDPRRFARQN